MKTTIACLIKQKSTSEIDSKEGSIEKGNSILLKKNIPIQLLRNLLTNKTIRKDIIELKKRDLF